MLLFLYHTAHKLNRSDNHFFIIPLFMKKILNKNLISILLIVFALVACGKIPDGIIEVKTANYRVLAITAPASFSYSQTDSTIVTTVQLANDETVSSLWCRVSSLDGTLIIKSQILIYDDGNVSLHGDQTRGDKLYSAKIVMGKLTPVGKYQIEYFIEDKINYAPDNLKKIGTHIFAFSPGQINLPPVISNLVIPNSATRNSGTAWFIFTVKVDDPNGLADIQEMYFKLYRPDGTLSAPVGQTFRPMVDNGDANFGDSTAGDGIYSYRSYFDLTAQVGVWRYEFQARDRSGNLSNVITHSMTVN
ncbi:hypothetical protein C0389_02885 [bacterium]|nr:hypothetical protein [bacterium]